MKKIYFLLLVGVLSIIIFGLKNAPKARAETVSLAPSADAGVWSDNADQNFSNNVFMVASHFVRENRAADLYIKFDLNSIPKNSIINSAVLTLYIKKCASASRDPTSLIVSNVETSWEESNITWNSRPPVWGYYLTGYPNCYNQEFVEPIGQTIILKNLVQKWIDQDWPNYGFRLANENSMVEFAINYCTRETIYKPKLEIEYVPPLSGANDSGGNQANNIANQKGISRGTNKAPGLTISNIILPPVELLARDWPKDWGGAVELFWVPSGTENIDGYHIYRSVEKDSGFVNLYNADKETDRLVDFQAETDKTFYYFVRTYRGSEESTNSNVVNLASRADLYDNIPSQRTTWAWWWKVILIVFLVGIVAVVAIIVVIFIIIRRRRKK